MRTDEHLVSTSSNISLVTNAYIMHAFCFTQISPGYNATRKEYQPFKYAVELLKLLLRQKEKGLAHFASCWFGTFAMLSCTTGSLVGHENTQRWMIHCYNGLKAYRFWYFVRFFCIAIFDHSGLTPSVLLLHWEWDLGVCPLNKCYPMLWNVDILWF